MNQEYKVNLTKGQKAKLAKAIKDGSALKLRLGKNSLNGNDELFLSPRQIAKLNKAKKNNTGAEISFSKSAIRKSIKQGGSLWTSLLKLTPFLTKGVSKVAPHLATGAMSALESLGIDKIFGSGMQGGTILPDAIVKTIQRGIEVPVKFFGEFDQLEGNVYQRAKNFDWKRPSKWERNCFETNKKTNSWGSFGNFGSHWNSHGN